MIEFFRVRSPANYIEALFSVHGKLI